MIPFSGFMPASTFPSSASEGKPAIPVKGFSDDDAIAPSDDTTDSFLQWVKKLVDGHTSEVPDGERGLNLEMPEDESKGPPADQNPMMIFSATAPTPPVPHGLPSQDSGRVGGAPPPAMPNMPTPQTAGSLGDGAPPEVPTMPLPLTSDNIGEGDAPGVPNMPPPLKADSLGEAQSAAVRHTPPPLKAGNVGAGQASDLPGTTNDTRPVLNVHRPPADAYAHPAASDPLSEGAPTGKAQEGGQRQPSPIGHPLPTEMPDMATRTGPGADDRSKETPLGVELPEDTSMKGRGNGNPRYPFQSVSQLNDKAQYGNDRFIQQGLADGPGIPAKNNDPVNPNSLPTDGAARDTESIVSALSNKNTSFPQDPSTHFNENRNSRNNPTRRNAVADPNEEDMQKGPASNSMKNSVIETIRSPLPVPDTAKAMAVDLSTSTADTPTAGQTATSLQTEAPATKTFQATVMDQIVDKAAMRSIHGRSEIRIQLKPEFLGNVQMNIAAEKNQLVVRIVADQSVVKDAIETHLHHLKAELQNQGLAVEKIEVLVNADADPQHNREHSSQMFKNNSFENGGRQYEEKNPEKREPAQNSEDNDSSDDDGDGINYFA